MDASIDPRCVCEDETTSVIRGGDDAVFIIGKISSPIKFSHAFTKEAAEKTAKDIVAM